LSLAKLRAVKQARQRWVKHPRVLAAMLLVLVAGGLIFAISPAHHRGKSPVPSLSRPATTHAAQSPADPAASAAKSAEAPKPMEEVALRPPPRADAAKPVWLRYAVPAPPSGNRPLVAVVLDDLGLDRARTAEAIRLQGPLTLSFMTYASELGQQTEAARDAGHELFLHVPMEAIDRHADPGPHALFTSQSRDEILDRLRWALGRFDGFVGINNHMGSKFTSDAHSMAPVMEELRARGLVFLDSRTSPASSGIRLAIAYGVPHAARDVFLDDDQTPAAIARRLARVEQVAGRHGSAIAIGHPHDTTITVLRTWLPRVEGKGLALVPVSAVVRRRMAEEGEAQR
jgi:polysaccharide deacetylase 2 family uncharacterized protein YibQ